ncbi:MAG: helix-hairpin-helix domain-containing protein [Chitinophagaceae bacterium]
MWKNFVKDYLRFTKKDRVGVIVLVALIFIVVLLPYMWPVKKAVQPSPGEIQQLQLQAAQLNKAADAAEQNEDHPGTYHFPAKENYTKEKAAIFYFDPNTLNAAGWKRLGIRDKTAATIQNYLARGGKFRKPEDLGKIYGLFRNDYERLLPYVTIASQPGFEKAGKPEKREYTVQEKTVYPVRHFSPPSVVEINTADTAALIALPGIGSKLAARIVNFRDKLGGFYAVQQLAETYGLPDSTFEKIKTLLQCNQHAVQQMDINTADANTLKLHPYIRWNLANAIVQYRVQHGNFKSVDELQRIAIVTPEILQKIKPYLLVQP